MEIYAAPLQGFTEYTWRNIHNEVFGGIDCYVTPFMRYERGEIRNKEIRDVEKKNNSVPHLIPQIIAATPDEMMPLVDFILSEGYSEVDINMGCSFALQVRHFHGAGLLPYPDRVEALMRTTERYPEAAFSVKMRLGWESKEEWGRILPILNGTRLSHITLHPRLGIEQYRRPASIDDFALFAEQCSHPMIYNGDLTTLDEMRAVAERFPNLKALMIGRGLLANPALGAEFKQQKVYGYDEKRKLVSTFHSRFFDAVSPRLQGNTQQLSKLKPYWEYLLPEMEKRHKKAIKKANTTEKYLAAVSEALR